MRKISERKLQRKSKQTFYFRELCRR